MNINSFENKYLEAVQIKRIEENKILDVLIEKPYLLGRGVIPLIYGVKRLVHSIEYLEYVLDKYNYTGDLLGTIAMAWSDNQVDYVLDKYPQKAQEILRHRYKEGVARRERNSSQTCTRCEKDKQKDKQKKREYIAQWCSGTWPEGFLEKIIQDYLKGEK